MTTQIELAANRLFGEGGLGCTKCSIFPGSNPNVTAEQIAAEINRSLSQIEAGDCEEVEIE